MEAFYAQLGELGAQLVAAEFAAESQRPSPEALTALLRRARSLYVAAAERVESMIMTKADGGAGGGDDDHDDAVKDTPCVGPCTFLWRGAKGEEKIRELLTKLQSTTSVEAAQSLYCEVQQLRPPGAKDVESYQLCQLTGFPCFVFKDQGARSCETSTALAQLQEFERESKLLLRYAEHVVHSRVLQIESSERERERERQRELELSSLSSLSSPTVLSGGGGGGGERHARVVSTCRAIVSAGKARECISDFYRGVPDLRGHSLASALRGLQGDGRGGEEYDEDVVNYLVTASPVEPLVQRVTPPCRQAVRASLTAQWLAHVERQGSSNFA